MQGDSSKSKHSLSAQRAKLCETSPSGSGFSTWKFGTSQAKPKLITQGFKAVKPKKSGK